MTGATSFSFQPKRLEIKGGKKVACEESQLTAEYD